MDESIGGSEPSPLDREIAALKRQGRRCQTFTRHLTTNSCIAAALRKTLQIQCSTILSSTSTVQLISSQANSGNLGPPTDPSRSKLISRSDQQRAYMQQCIYRISSPVTSFKVLDPDPNAVDGGHVLGLRFEIMSRGQFLRPYYVMLNRPYPNSKHLRVHRHTVPPAVPLAGLAARHLPAPKSGEGERASRQDLDRFVRTLRREIVRYHNRLGVSADLRRRLVLHDRAEQQLSANALVEVGVADIEAKQINLTWADDRTGRLVMDDDGKVLKFVVFSKDGRDWETTKEIFGKNNTVEDVMRKLEEHMAEEEQEEEVVEEDEEGGSEE